MKKTILFFTGFFAVCTLLFTACSKNNDPKPDIDDTEEPTNKGAAEQLKKDIIGKWTIEGSTFVVKSATAKTGLNASASKRMASAKIAATKNTTATTAFIEFLEDGTFIILDNNGNVSTGDYTAKDGQTIDLSGFGSIKDIKFDNSNISCVMHYTQSGSAKTLTVKGKKTVQISASDRTTLLCQRWQVEQIKQGGWYWINWFTNNDTGESTYETVWQESAWENGIWIENPHYDDIHPVEFEKFIVQFSPSGTYLAQMYDNQGKLIEATVEYWKWHPTDANKLVTWTSDEPEPTSNFNDAISDITELTQSKLSIQSHGDDDEYQHITFKSIQ